MKTLANCTPREFASQTLKIANKIKKYKSGLEKAKNAVEDGENNFFAIMNYVLGDNVDETMGICADLCFMTPDEFANLKAEGENGIDGIALVLTIVNTPRVESFFTTLFKLKTYTKMLS